MQDVHGKNIQITKPACSRVSRFSLFAKDEAATLKIGRRLGKQLQPGDVVCLYGCLGAGKTTLTKAIASSLDIPEREITSASFTIIAEHYGRLPLYHVDFYRLENGGVEDTGIEDYFVHDGITVIEWPERGESVIPDERINVRINIEPVGRTFEIESPRTLSF